MLMKLQIDCKFRNPLKWLTGPAIKSGSLIPLIGAFLYRGIHEPCCVQKAVEHPH